MQRIINLKYLQSAVSLRIANQIVDVPWSARAVNWCQQERKFGDVAICGDTCGKRLVYIISRDLERTERWRHCKNLRGKLLSLRGFKLLHNMIADLQHCLINLPVFENRLRKMRKVCPAQDYFKRSSPGRRPVKAIGSRAVS